jgi:hypothetical protein
MSESAHRGCDAEAQAVLEALARLDDVSLHAAVVRAQTLLLDRPPPAQGTPALLVEVVQREELRFLVSYRALAPSARRRVQRALMRAVQLSRLRVRCVRPATVRLPTTSPRSSEWMAVSGTGPS